jgi:hypothetical protein
VEPKATYTVTLTDLTTGTPTTVLAGELDDEDEAFVAAAAPVAVLGGHTYRLSIDTVTAQSTVALSLLSGTTSLRFDNVGLTVRSLPAGKGGGGEGDNGSRRSSSNAISDRRLFSLLSSGAASGPAVLEGSRLFIKVGCPGKIGRSCRITAQGLLGKHRPATAKRTVKVRRGKGRRIALRVRPKARGKVAKRKRLLVRERVHAGEAEATVYRQRKLIRRG